MAFVDSAAELPAAVEESLGADRLRYRRVEWKKEEMEM